MKETKFRGMRSDGKGWVYGYLVRADERSKFDGEDFSDSYIVETLAGDFIQFCFGGSDLKIEALSYRVKQDSVGQYTGLKDKNGVEIYEGDIVEMCALEFRQVKYFAPAFDVYPHIDEPCNGLGLLAGNGLITVAGNIYENPELLEGGK